MEHKYPPKPGQPLSYKVAGISALAAATKTQAPVPGSKDQIYNAPERAAQGKKPLKAAAAPRHLAILPAKGQLTLVPTTGNGYAIYGEGGYRYAEATSMAGLLPWLTTYAEEVDRLTDTSS